MYEVVKEMKKNIYGRLIASLNGANVGLKSGDKVVFYDKNSYDSVLYDLDYLFRLGEIQNYQHEFQTWNDNAHATASFCWVDKDDELSLLTFNYYV